MMATVKVEKKGSKKDLQKVVKKDAQWVETLVLTMEYLMDYLKVEQ